MLDPPPHSRRLDDAPWPRWARQAEDLARGFEDHGMRVFADGFFQMGLPPPRAVILHERQKLALEDASRLLEWYSGLKDGDLLPSIEALDPFNLKSFMGNLAIVEPCEELPGNYRFRLYGSRIANHSGVDLSQKTIFDIPYVASIPEGIPIFFSALNQTAQNTGKPVVSVHLPPKVISARFWYRLALPFGALNGPSRVLVQLMTVARDDADRLLQNAGVS